MNLDCLLKRKEELDANVQQLTNSWQIIQGHKAEVDYWIEAYNKCSKDETKVDDAVVIPSESPVE